MNELASATAKTDDFVYDFMNGIGLDGEDTLILINPTSPLLTCSELRDGVREFQEGDYNSMNTVVKHQIHTMMYDNGMLNGINCSLHGKLQKTQDLTPTYTMAFAFMGWRVGPFKKAYEKNGYALFNPPCYFHEVSGKTAINKLSYEEDWEVVERILTGSYGPPRYHEAITRLVK
jgi:CMP-N-acetylneuraminic acid synthetase